VGKSRTKAKKYQTPCKLSFSCKFLALGTCEYLHTKLETETVKLPPREEESKQQLTCQIGKNCVFLLKGECKFQHNIEDVEWAEKERKEKTTLKPCAGKENCQHLALKSCKFLHTKGDYESVGGGLLKVEGVLEKNEKGKCQHGAKCEYLLRGSCGYEHGSEEREWAEKERERKQMKVVCKKKGECKHLEGGNCRFLHTREEWEEAERKRKEGEVKRNGLRVRK